MQPDIAETCARRGITRAIHCHADHFEPEEVSKRFGSAADIALWLERCKPAVPTLFVKCPLGFRLNRAAPIGMTLNLNSSAPTEALYLHKLVEFGAGVGLHVHHEAWTYNAIPRAKLSDGQRVLHDYVMAKPHLDAQRMSTMVTGSLAWLRETTGLELKTWGFVHGCWAFGASDPEICQLRDEIPLLYELGCRADFSFPAGRRYCDPSWDRPKWIVPVRADRAFEAPKADPRDEYDASRMLVWASRTDAWWLGLDTYSRDSRRLTESPDKLERYLELCPVIDGTAYVKTCSHGMHPHYWPAADDPRPTVGAFAFDLMAKLGRIVPVDFLTAEQMVSELRR